METVINVKGLSKTFTVRENQPTTIKQYLTSVFNLNRSVHKIRALKNINFDVKKGEIFGIIGRNGSGKSTLLKIILGAIKPDKGSIVETHGSLIRLTLGMGFDTNLSARENIYVNGSILGMTFKHIGNIFEEIIAFAELEEFVDTPIKFYSSGMKSRLAFSIAVNADSDIFLMDEFFGGVGDESFRKKSDEVFKEAFLKGRTIMNVSHSMANIKEYCGRVLLINKGEQLALGTPDEVIPIYESLFNKKKKKK